MDIVYKLTESTEKFIQTTELSIGKDNIIYLLVIEYLPEKLNIGDKVYFLIGDTIEYFWEVFEARLIEDKIYLLLHRPHKIQLSEEVKGDEVEKIVYRWWNKKKKEKCIK